MALDPQCRQLLELMAAQGGPQLHEMMPEQARALDLAPMGVPVEELERVEDRQFDGIPVRIYRPTLEKPLPALMYFHGGGYVVGSLDSHDRECRSLANQTGCVVISVGYRLAPEDKYPAAFDDCFLATKYASEHAGELGIDPARLAVGGDSCGGNLAACVALMARDKGGPKLAFQLLIYPWCESNATGGSMDEYAQDHFLTAEGLQWFHNLYFEKPEDRVGPYASASHAPSHRDLPPAFIITAECDPLCDQGEAYARKLQGAGVTVAHKRYPGMIHPFFSLGGVIDMAREAIEDAAFELRMALATGKYVRKA